MGGQVARRVGQVGGDVLDDVERAVHPPPVAGIGADIRIHARLRRGGEARASATRAGRAAGWRRGSCRRAARSSARGPPAGCSTTRPAGRPLRASPGLVTTKLCGMMSLFSKTISTGLPASAAIRSLLKSIWSVIVPSRITRTPRSPSSRRAFVARSGGSKPASESPS